MMRAWAVGRPLRGRIENRSWRRCCSALVVAAVVVLPSGCVRRGSEPSPDATEREAAIVESSAERGPVQLHVSLRPGAPRLSDEPVLTLTIRAPRGVDIEKPPFGEAVGEFLVRDFHEPLPESDGPVTVIRQQYTLEPIRAGTLSIDPITVEFVDRRSKKEQRSQVQSEALTVEVSTVLGDEAPSLTALRPATAPVELPAARRSMFGWVMGGVVGLTLLAAVEWLRRRRKADEPELSAKELAWLELEQLIAADLVGADVKAYYGELTGVVRRFIERSTGIRAPEQTTEEFLRAITRYTEFSVSASERLADFLQAADLVKFAGHQPASRDIEESFVRAQRFIGLDQDVSVEASG